MAKKKKPVARGMAHAKREEPCNVPNGRGARRTLFTLVLLFTLMAFAIDAGIVAGASIYWMLVAAASVFLLFEAYLHRNEPGAFGKALLIGLSLMVFDFMFENAGWVLGLWQTFGGIAMFGAVPVEIMLVCLIGGTAWALYLPRRYDRAHTLMDMLVFAAYGAFGEFMLMRAGLMDYFQWWNSWLAFASYAFVWAMLHYIRYKVVKP